MARGVPVEIDGEQCHLFYSMRAVQRIEEHFEISFLEGDVIDSVSFEDAMWLIMLGLEHEQPDPPSWWDRLLAALRIRECEEPLTAERLSEVLDVRGMNDVVEKVAEALHRGDQEEDETKKKGS